MSIPTVATDIRGCRQVVVDGQTGHLVPVGDAAALAVALERLIRDPAERRRFGAAARDRALVEFDQQRVIARTLAVYRSLLMTKGLTANGTLLPQPGAAAETSAYRASIDLVADSASKRNEVTAAA